MKFLLLKAVNLLIILEFTFTPRIINANMKIGRLIARYKFTLIKNRKNIRLKDIAKFILDILNGSLKINSSIIGKNNVSFKIL